MPSTFKIRPLACSALLLTSSLLTSCGVNSTTASGNTPLTSHITGKVHGGQQPVKNATIQLYTVGISGDGSASTPMLSATVTTDASGFFDITGKYTCTSATYVYLVGTGGDPGVGSTNPNLAMMAALGPCSSLTPSTFIMVNELTTVAAVYALAPYMTSLTAIGSGSGDASSLAAAFTLASEFVDTATGLSPGSNVPAGMSVPTALMNTLADIVASCINTSGGVAGDPSLCGQFFSLTTPGGGTAPTDTITALLNLATHTDLNTDALFALAPPTAPFQPVLSMSPPAFLVRLTPSTMSGYVLQVSPSGLTFPDTAITSTSSSQTVTLENSGLSTITLSGINFTGANFSDFGQTNTCGTALATHASCSIQVTMTPSATAPRNAYLSVTSSSPDSPQYVALAGTGLSSTSSGPLLSLGVLTMGVVPGGIRDVTVTNVGNAPLTISGVTSATADFVVTNGCTGSITPSGTCILSVANHGPSIQRPKPYTNLSGGIAQLSGPVGAVTINSDSVGGVRVLGLGNFQMPLALQTYFTTSVSPGNAMFAQTVVGQTSTTTIRVIPQRDGSGNIEGQSLAISGANAGDFSQSESCQWGSSSYFLLCSITVRFTPSAAGSRSARLYLDPIDYIPLAGSGVSSVPSEVSLSSGDVVLTDMMGPQYVTLTNSGGSAVHLSSITISDGFTLTSDCGTSVDANAVCTINVDSPLASEGGIEGLVTVSGDFGTLQKTITAMVDPVVQFGSAAVGTVSPIQPKFNGYSSSNGSGEVIDSYDAFFAGVNAGDFTVVYCGSACNNLISATPGSVGVRTAQMQTEPEPFLVEVTGVAPGPNISFGGDAYLYNTPGTAASPLNHSSLPLMIWNTGTTTLTLATPTITGANATDFSVQSSCTTLAVGQSCPVTVNFVPTESTVVLDTAQINFSDTTSGSSFAWSVKGLNYGTQILPVGSQLSFPDTKKSSVSAPQSVSFTEPGGLPMKTELIGDTTDFVLTKGSCAAGESPCVITVEFAPMTTGTLVAIVEIEEEGGASHSSVVVTGKGTP